MYLSFLRNYKTVITFAVLFLLTPIGLVVLQQTAADVGTRLVVPFAPLLAEAQGVGNTCGDDCVGGQVYRGALGCDPGLYCANPQLMDYCGYDYNYEQGTCQPIPNPVDGACAATHYNCSAGVRSGGTYNSSTGVYSWTCLGTDGGANANCTEGGAVNGVCAATHYNCTAGVQNPVSYGYTPAQGFYYWYCDGLYGGTQQYCYQYVPINGKCDNTVTNGCVSGNSANSSSHDGYFWWSCNGVNGGTSDNTCKRLRSVNYANLTVSPSTVPYGGYATYSWTSGPNAESCLLRTKIPPNAGGTSYPANGSVTIGPLYSNVTYNGYCINGSDPSMWYFGASGEPWGDFVTVTVLPQNGSCATTHYACAVGTSINGYDAGDRWLWDCQGANGGTTASGCSEMKPINGVCASTHYGCATVPAAMGATENGMNWQWTCPGQYGGSNTPCMEAKVLVNGVCGPTPANSQHYQCSMGSPVNMFYDGAYHYSWDCNGSAGGDNMSCAENLTPPPVNGKCDYVPGHTYQCSVGASFGAYDAGDSWKWNCAGAFGGVTDACTVMKPVNGVCAGTHYACAKGTSAANVDGATQWTWTCNGLYGGLASGCIEDKPAPLPVVTWNPSAMTIDYNTKASYSYTTTNAVSCVYEALDPATGNVTDTIDTNAPLTSSWVGPQGPYEKDVRRRLTCKNKDGIARSSEIYITVRQNDAACVSVTAPAYLALLEPFTVTAKMKNLGTNPWSADYNANYVLWTSDSIWGADQLLLTNAPVGGGQEGRFKENLTAPAAEKDYDFIWQMRPVFAGNWWPVFGQPCSITTTNGNKIRVKSPTLAVDPQSYQFADTVIGDAPSTVKIHVKNLGGGKITEIKIDPSDLVGTRFSCSAHCSITLLGGGEDDITLSFDPVATGTVSKNVHLINKEGYPLVITTAGQPALVDYLSIYGTGVDKFTLSSDEGGLSGLGGINFGEYPWTRTKYMNVYVRNKSLTQSGSISPNVDPSAAFSCVSGCAPSVVPPGGYVMIRLKFLPPYQRVENYEGQLNIGATPDRSFIMTGTGVKPEFSTIEK